MHSLKHANLKQIFHKSRMEVNEKLVERRSWGEPCRGSNRHVQIHIIPVIHWILCHIFEKQICPLRMGHYWYTINFGFSLYVFNETRNIVLCDEKPHCFLPIFKVRGGVQSLMLKTMLVASWIGQPHIVARVSQDKRRGFLSAIDAKSVRTIDKAMVEHNSCPGLIPLSLMVPYPEDSIDEAIFCVH